MTQLICGILRLDGTPPDRALVRRMAASMIAPGLRHEIRVASRGPVVMAAIRLALRGDRRAPAEAALIETDDTLLVADISVYDRARLQLSGQDPGPSDGAFLRAVLAEQGTGALGDLHGDFAFAAWRDGCLTLGRDHFGARSVVYVERPARCQDGAARSTVIPSANRSTGRACPASVMRRWPIWSPQPNRASLRSR